MINGTSTHRLRLALAALASAAVLLLDLNLDLGRIAISGGIEQRALSALEDTPFGGGPSPERELLTMPRLQCLEHLELIFFFMGEIFWEDCMLFLQLVSDFAPSVKRLSWIG